MKKSPPVREIGVVFKTHLDIGFTDFAGCIVKKYIEDYIPRALELAEQTREIPYRFVWTTGSWLVWKYLEDAPRTGRRRMESAIRHGDFNWHALPFTTHTELMDRELFSAGLAISRRLDERFGRRTCSAKMTDVPGHTCAMIPLLAAAGVKYLDIGINPASAVPDVPPVFRWQCDQAEIVVAYHGDYGRLAQLPGNRALSIQFTGDNLGPQTPEEISRIYDDLAALHPGARIKPVGLCQIGRHLWKHRAQLPVVKKEIGDSWIHGAATDPLKISRYRAILRLRNAWIRSGRVEAEGAVDQELSEALLLTAEHTCGMDLKTHLKDWKNYLRRDFEAVRKTRPFRTIEKSWQEQRAYVEQAVSHLPARLRSEAEQALAELRPRLKHAGGWVKKGLSAEVMLEGWKLQIDPTCGALRSVIASNGQRLDAGRHMMAALAYQTYSAQDYHRFYRQYIRGEAEWSRQDFTKPGLPAASKAGRIRPALKNIYHHRTDARVKLEMVFPANAVRQYGAPACVFMEWAIEMESLALRLEWYDKAANRMPEAIWLDFCPVLRPRDGWEIEKLGRWIDMKNVVRRGGQNLQAMDHAVRAGRFVLNSLDAPLVAPGTGSLLNYVSRIPSSSEGISINLYNNIWGTNFPMWYQDNTTFRFGVSF